MPEETEEEREEREELDESQEMVESIPQQLQSMKTSYKPLSGDETRWMFDYRLLYWEIKARLMGGWITQAKDKSYLVIKPKDATPEMNSTGVEATMAYINSFVTLIQALSFIDEERVYVLCKDLWIKMAKLYFRRMEEFDLTPDKANIVLRIVMHLVETNLRKSINGNALKVLATTEKRIETIVGQQRKGGIMSHIPFIGGR